MIPKDFEWENKLSFEKALDNTSLSIPVFEQTTLDKDVRKVQLQFQNSLQKTLFKRNRTQWDEEKVKNFLKKDKQTLDALALTIMWTCGYPPRGFQAVHLQHRIPAKTNGIRNLFTMFQGHPVLGFPDKKGARGIIQSTL